jgi:hypothetical protein
VKNHLLADAAVFAMLGLFCARQAAGEIVNCNNSPSSCTTFNASVIGGPNPYVYIQDAYFNDTSDTYFDPASPTQINYNFNNGAVVEKATGSLATGITGVYAEGDSTGDTVKIFANDIFTLNGPSGGGPVDITAIFHAAGTASLAPVASNAPLVGGGNATLQLCGPGGSFACVADQFNLGGIPFAGYSGPVFSEYTSEPYLQAESTFSESAGSTFNVYYSLIASVSAGGDIDLYDPGQLSFDLPAGYSISSVSGFQFPAPTTSTVPEPGSLGLLACVMGVLFGRQAAARLFKG